MALPDWLDYRQSASAAAALMRRLSNADASWGQLIAAAQVIMGIYQDQDASPQFLPSLYAEASGPLIAAARILDSASQDAERITTEARRYLALTAAVTFSMAGNFRSSRAAMARYLDEERSPPTEMFPIIATADPTTLSKMLALSSTDSPESAYLSSLNAFLTTGEVDRIESTRILLADCFTSTQTSLGTTLLGSCFLSLEHLFHLSVARVMHDIPVTFPKNYIRSLIEDGITVFLPPQFKALSDERMLSRSGNELITLPTGTGKTLLGELCLLSSLGTAPGLVCYVAPYVALGRQVADTLRRRLPLDVRVHRLIGAYAIEHPLAPSENPEVIVATPERLDGLLRTDPRITQHIRCIVWDEAHMVESVPRGTRMEGILTRLRMLQQQGTPLRIVLLSAVLSKYDSIAEWLGIQPEAVIKDGWRPTARRLATWRENGRLVWLHGNDLLRPIGQAAESTLGDATVPWPETGFYVSSNWGQRRSLEPRIYRNIAYLAQWLWENYSHPILAVCTTRASSRGVARAVSQRFDRLEPLPPDIAWLIARIESIHGFLRPLSQMLSKGVAFHNASLPHEIRLAIEDAAKRRDLRFVAATTTLAEGVDLPFRFTVLVDWLVYQGNTTRPMSPMLFNNIAGRCGRPGEFTEGDTIIFDNPLGRLDFTDSLVRYSRQLDLMLDRLPNEVVGSLGGDLEGNERDRVLSYLGSQVLASIPENPGVEDLGREFSRNTLAFHSANSQKRRAEARVRDVIHSILDDGFGALATAASPLRLTEMGEAANIGGLSPSTARQMFSFLRDSEFLLTPSISSIGALILQKFSAVPEQTNSDLRAVVDGRRSDLAVKTDDFKEFLDMWVRGEELEEIFSLLPYTIRSTRRPRVREWLAGGSGPSDWDAVYDKFVDFVDSVVQRFLPWMMRAASPLSKVAGGWGSDQPWREWSDRIEYGVDTEWAVTARKMGAPGDRTLLAEVGRLWPSGLVTERDSLGVLAIGSDRLAEQIRVVFTSFANAPEVKRRRLAELMSWLSTMATSERRAESYSDHE